MTDAERPVPLLVLGLGNLLYADDGLGVVAVQRLLDQYEPSPGVLVLDGGTLGLSLLPYLDHADRVLLVDAIRDDAPPGTFVRLDGDDVAPAVAARLSVHQIGVADLLEGARWIDRYPPVLVLLGLVPQRVELSLHLSAPVEAGVDPLVERVIEEARRLGFEFRPRRNHAPHSVAPGMDAVSAFGL